MSRKADSHSYKEENTFKNSKPLEHHQNRFGGRSEPSTRRITNDSIEDKSYQKIIDNPQHIPNFSDAETKYNTKSIAIFLTDTVYSWATDKGLTRISRVAPWLHMTFSQVKQRTVKRLAEQLMKNATDDHDLEVFIRTIAHKLEPRPFVNDPEAFKRNYKDGENLEDYLHRTTMQLKATTTDKNIVPMIVEK